MKTRISIIIPVYNVEQYIADSPYSRAENRGSMDDANTFASMFHMV